MGKSTTGRVSGFSVLLILIGVFAVGVGLVAFRSERDAQDENMRPLMDRARASGAFIIADTQLRGKLAMWRNLIWAGAALSVTGVLTAGISSRRPGRANDQAATSEGL